MYRPAIHSLLILFLLLLKIEVCSLPISVTNWTYPSSLRSLTILKVLPATILVSLPGYPLLKITATLGVRWLPGCSVTNSKKFLSIGTSLNGLCLYLTVTRFPYRQLLASRSYFPSFYSSSLKAFRKKWFFYLVNYQHRYPDLLLNF